MNKNSIVEKIAQRSIESYIMLKLPLGYSLVQNAKSIVKNHAGVDIQDEDLEEVLARFLDLIVFSLMKDVKDLGSEMPQPDAFYKIVGDVIKESQEDGDIEFADDDEDRFPSGDDDSDDELMFGDDAEEQDEEGLRF